MTQTIYLNGRRHNLDQSQLIQAGGEGMVFRLGSTAIKLYHTPNPAHIAKLRHLWDSGLGASLPTAVYTPTTPITDQHNQIIGFQMPLLPDGAQPLKKLANPIFCQKQAIEPQHLIPLFRNIHHTLDQLHRNHVIVGDLNDLNLVITQSPPTLTSAWIDVDSYQFGGFPCPVAMVPFLDPTLYHVQNFGDQPYFTTLTDWYAYTVLLVKSLLGVHPYGGTHPQHKSLQARAQARVSLLDSSITYPRNGRSPHILSDDLLHHIHRIFTNGERLPFPPNLLDNILRPTGQSLKSKEQKLKPIHQSSSINLKSLFSTDGFIEDLRLWPTGRLQAIVREGQTYKLVRLGIGGVLGEMVLFEGNVGYRFGQFGNFVVVNPPGRNQLLILDVSGSQPQKVTMIETATFQGTAVVATTAKHLYRIAGTWIMRGQVRDGLYIEDPIATAHKNQTQFWASPYTEAIAGYHRIFAENRFFVLRGQSNYDLTTPPTNPGDSVKEIGAVFGPTAVAFNLAIHNKGHQRHEQIVTDLHGQIQQITPDGAPANPFISLPAGMREIATAVVHPQGTILWQPQSLTLQKI